MKLLFIAFHTIELRNDVTRLDWKCSLCPSSTSLRAVEASHAVAVVRGPQLLSTSRGRFAPARGESRAWHDVMAIAQDSE